MTKAPLLTVAMLALGAQGCSSAIGDSCSNSVDCSTNGDRLCDRSLPDGYCTIRDCEPDSCPKEGMCVQFRPENLRLSSTWCMAKCSTQSDCRDDRSGGQGYDCVLAAELGSGIAEALDNTEGRFCAGVPLEE